jgi:hypothetical protein
MSRHLRFVLFAAAAIAAGACSDNPTGPGSNTLDLSALLAEMSPSSVSAATTFATSAVGPMMPVTSSSFDPTQCTYSQATGFFVCPTLTTNGLTITRMYRLIDAAGNSQSLLNGQTSAIETKMTVKGTPTQPQSSTGGPITIDERSDMTLSGIRTVKHTLNGVSTTTLTGSFDLNGTPVPISTTMDQTTTNLVLPNVTVGQKWPQSGTIAFDETVSPVSPAITHVLMTFNGTSIVTVTITDAFGTSTCHFDMANPGVSGGACS